jgi:hypothetical protein
MRTLTEYSEALRKKYQAELDATLVDLVKGLTGTEAKIAEDAFKAGMKFSEEHQI